MYKRIIIVAIAILLFSSRLCAQNTGAGFALPTIPQSVITPTDRANYLALHYWGNLDMSKQAMVENEATKQAFADFISILPHTDKEHRVLLKNTTPAKVEEYLSAR